MSVKLLKQKLFALHLKLKQFAIIIVQDITFHDYNYGGNIVSN